MSEKQSEKPKPGPPVRPRADKAEFKIAEKKLPLEKIPELEEAIKPEKGPTPPEAAPPKLPQISPEALRPTINMLAMRWNLFLEAPAGDEKDRYRWNQQDTDNIINSMTALDEKYHFMGNWIQYMPELFALIVVGGIVAKLVLGSRWKNAQKQAGPAAPPPEQKPSILDRLKGAVQPATGPPAGGVPPDLVKEAAEYIEASKRPQT